MIADDLTQNRPGNRIERPLGNCLLLRNREVNLPAILRPGETCFRFWQEGAGFDRDIFSREALEASLNYLHMNPVIDWRWSSARYHEEAPLHRQHNDLPHLHGFPSGAFD